MSRMSTGSTAARGRCEKGGTNRPSSTARAMCSPVIATSNPTRSALIWSPGPKTIPGRTTGTTPWGPKTHCFVSTRPTRHLAPPSPPAGPHIANCSAPARPTNRWRRSATRRKGAGCPAPIAFVNRSNVPLAAGSILPGGAARQRLPLTKSWRERRSDGVPRFRYRTDHARTRRSSGT